MDYLQYIREVDEDFPDMSFKPYYKWITFNISIIKSFLYYLFRF